MGTIDTASSDQIDTDITSQEVFTDRNQSIGLGNSIAEQASNHTWLLHMDEAVVSDDDDNDILMQIRLEPVPGPTTINVLVLAGLTALTHRKLRGSHVI